MRPPAGITIVCSWAAMFIEQQNESCQLTRPFLWASQAAPSQRSPSNFHHLAHEIPLPRDRAIRLQGIDLGTERGKVDAIAVGNGRAEDRLTAGDLAHDRPVPCIENEVGTGHGAEVEETVEQGGRGDVVAVHRSARRRCLPNHLAAPGFDAEGNTGGVDDVEPAVGTNRCSEHGVGERHRRRRVPAESIRLDQARCRSA